MKWLSLLLLVLAGTLAAQEQPLSVNTTRVQALEPLPAEKPTQPYMLYDAIVDDLQHVPLVDQWETRYISRWPVTADKLPELEAALEFWMASLNNRRTNPPLVVTEDGLMYRIRLSDYDWSTAAWDAMAAADPYFQVTTINSQYLVRRGWLDPSVEAQVRQSTHCTQAVVRADYFLARTSLEVNGVGFEKGFYSQFKRFPATETELFKLLGVDQNFANKNLLVRGGAVLESIVALHNRELQLLNSQWGLDMAYVWRSLDTASDKANKSVLENFMGTVNPDGREYIGTNLNGLHWYYLSNAAGNQVAFVPQNIAQDKANVHDVTVTTPWKCVACHTPQQGIRHFDDAVSKIALSPNTGLAVITEYKHKQDAALVAKVAFNTRRALEDYYMSNLAQTINLQRAAYAKAVEAATGMSPEAVTKAYLNQVQQYLYGRVDKQQAAREFGIAPDKIDAYLKTTGNPQLITLLSGQTIAREVFEGAYNAGMQRQVFSWEGSVSREISKSQPAVVAALRVPTGAYLVQPHSADPVGSIRFYHQGLLYLHRADGSRFVWRANAWDELDR